MTEAIARMNVGGKESRVSNTSLGHAPLATPEVVDLGSEYSQVIKLKHGVTMQVNMPCFLLIIFLCR